MGEHNRALRPSSTSLPKPQTPEGQVPVRLGAPPAEGSCTCRRGCLGRGRQLLSEARPRKWRHEEEEEEGEQEQEFERRRGGGTEGREGGD